MLAPTNEISVEHAAISGKPALDHFRRRQCAAGHGARSIPAVSAKFGTIPREAREMIIFHSLGHSMYMSPLDFDACAFNAHQYHDDARDIVLDVTMRARCAVTDALIIRYTGKIGYSLLYFIIASHWHTPLSRYRIRSILISIPAGSADIYFYHFIREARFL